MPIKLFRFKDGSYISSDTPLSRRYDVENKQSVEKKEEKKKAPIKKKIRYEDLPQYEQMRRAVEYNHRHNIHAWAE